MAMRNGMLKEYAKLMRLEYCGLSIVAAMGALSVKGRGADALDILLLFSINVFVVIAGFVHNDYVDVEIDARSPELRDRPLVKGTISRSAAFRLIGVCEIAAPVLLFVVFRNGTAVLLLLVSSLLTVLYNIFGKKIVGADVLYAGSAAVLCLCGAVAVCDPEASMSGLPSMTWVIVAMIFMAHWFFNAVPGCLKDIENDRASGVKTLAVQLSENVDGKTRISGSFAFFALSIQTASILLAFTPFVFLQTEWAVWQLVLLAVLGIGSLALTLRLLGADLADRDSTGRRALRATVVSNALIPVVLATTSGITWMLLLLLLPFLWFAVFNYAIHGKVFRLPRAF